MKVTTRYAMAPLVGLALVACGAAQLNQNKLTDVQADLRSAQEIGATQHPDAALHIELANEEVAKAKQLADAGEDELAELMLDRAQADAQLALQLARTKQLRSEAQQAWNKVENLRAEQTN